MAFLKTLISLTLSAALTAAAQQRPLVVGYFLQGSVQAEKPFFVKDLIAPDGSLPVDQIDYSQGFVAGGRCSVANPDADLNYTFHADQSVNGRADDPTQPLRGNFHQLVELKRRFPATKVVISLEGRAQDFAFIARPENRAALISSCMTLFIQGHLGRGAEAPGLFDGIDVDWEYPRGEDAANFAALMTGLRQALDATRPGLLLTIAAGPSPRMYEGTDMAVIARIVDQLGLMTYDFSGPWSRRTGLIAPLYPVPGRQGESVERTVSAFLAAGVPPEKLLLGLPFYGYGWKMVDEEANGLFQEGRPIRGDFSYRDIQAIATHSTIFREPVSQAPFLFDGDAFWTYDDPASIDAKTRFAMQRRLGGVMIWELAGDTEQGDLLRAAKGALNTK